MSLPETLTDFLPSLSTALLDGSSSEFEVLREELLDKIDLLKKIVFKLEEYETQLGTNIDTKSFRVQMKKNIAQGNGTIMKIMNFLQQFDSMILNNKEDLDYRSKLSKRIQMNFEVYRERYTKILRGIYSKETKTKPVESNHSTQASIAQDSTQILDETIPEQEVKMYLDDLSIYQPIFEKSFDQVKNNIRKESNYTLENDHFEEETECSVRLKETNNYEKKLTIRRQLSAKKSSKKGLMLGLGALLIIAVVLVWFFMLRKLPYERN